MGMEGPMQQPIVPNDEEVKEEPQVENVEGSSQQETAREYIQELDNIAESLKDFNGTEETFSLVSTNSPGYLEVTSTREQDNEVVGKLSDLINNSQKLQIKENVYADNSEYSPNPDGMEVRIGDILQHMVTGPEDHVYPANFIRKFRAMLENASKSKK